MKRFISIILFSLVVTSSYGIDFKWKTVRMDGSRTGTSMPNPNDLSATIGVVEKNTYTAPNGRKYRGGSTVEVARLMTEAQPALAHVKEVIGYSEEEMVRHKPQCELSNWFVDVLMKTTSEAVDRPVDIGIYNFGGIRADLPKGNVTVDDILSIFPFNNFPAYVALKGSDVKYIFERMAEHGVQAVGGVQMVVRDRRLESLLVGGQPVDDKKIYGLVTIDFLLNGGDGLNLARNAQDLIITDKKVSDVVIPYIRRITAEGRSIRGEIDDRVTIIKTEATEEGK